jgi:glycosyltransferase involved in cell wall biosynthesis
VKPFFSIITINYNNCFGLRRTVESVIEQDFKSFEYIIIDGASSDGSTEYITLNENHFSYWVSESDQGIYHAMNKGIKAANGDYLLFLNSGDLLINSTVLSNVHNSNLKADIVYGNLLKGDFHSYTRDCGLASDNITGNYMIHSTLNHPSSFIKLSLFERYGLYNEKLKIVSDWEFFFKVVVLKSATVKYIDIDITLFDLNGISNSHIKIRNEERNQVLNEFLPSRILEDYYTWSKRSIDLLGLDEILSIQLFKIFYRILVRIARIIKK